MKIKIIVAHAKDKGIGKNNQLLWHLPKDMAFFKQSTLGHCIITGRKNYESIPEKFRPLKDRTNIVVTRQENYEAPGAVVKNSLVDAIQYARANGESELYIIGGGQIYSQALELGIVNEMIITEVDAQVEAEVFFPDYYKSEWEQEMLAHFETDEKHKFSFSIYKYHSV